MNIPIIILGAVEQLIVWTIILPQTGWWFAIFGIAAVFNIVSNLGSLGESSPTSSYDDDYYYDDHRAADKEVFRTSSVSERDEHITTSYEQPEEDNFDGGVNVVSKPVDPRRKVTDKGSDELLKSGFKVVKKLKE
jgi:basic membrane lipoprotein Med (substrate-binding protein (PBP1-ABC) superfamily)